MANKGLQGIVIDQAGQRVKVRVFRNNTCENCDCVLQEACDPEEPGRSHRGMFDIFTDRSTLELKARNAADAKVGDRCLIKIKDEKSIVKASFLVYLMPGILFLLGLVGGGWLGRAYGGFSGDAEILAQLGGGLVLLALSYLGTKVYLWLKGTGEYVPEVTEVIRRA